MRYTRHQNLEGDPDYEAFLCRLADPLLERLGRRATGLDYGCGPTQVLASIMTRRGYPTASYDPYFNADEGVHERQFDFITCSEVIEHVHDPRALLDRLAPMIRVGGLLGVMTRYYDVDAPFADWWYRRDPTHVCFYSPATMQWIAEWKGWDVDFPRQHVAIFAIA